MYHFIYTQALEFDSYPHGHTVHSLHRDSLAEIPLVDMVVASAEDCRGPDQGHSLVAGGLDPGPLAAVQDIATAGCNLVEAGLVHLLERQFGMMEGILRILVVVAVDNLLVPPVAVLQVGVLLVGVPLVGEHLVVVPLAGCTLVVVVGKWLAVGVDMAFVVVVELHRVAVMGSGLVEVLLQREINDSGRKS